jgi:Pyridoxamine 5'-phosphate oxidase
VRGCTIPRMASFADVQAAEPEFAGRVRATFDAHAHKVLATLRADGSPRVSGIEMQFVEGEPWLAGMPQSVKFADLRGDPRFALHSGSDDPDVWAGDATVSGTVEEVDPDRIEEIFGQAPPGPSHLFRADITELTVVTLNEARDHLILESWVHGRGYRRRTRT